jgi:protein-tyrosine phosphatase
MNKMENIHEKIYSKDDVAKLIAKAVHHFTTEPGFAKKNINIRVGEIFDFCEKNLK